MSRYMLHMYLFIAHVIPQNFIFYNGFNCQNIGINMLFVMAFGFILIGYGSFTLHLNGQDSNFFSRSVVSGPNINSFVQKFSSPYSFLFVFQLHLIHLILRAYRSYFHQSEVAKCLVAIIFTVCYNVHSQPCAHQSKKVKWKSSRSRGGSRGVAISKMERFVIIVNGWKPLTIVTKRSILDITAALDQPRRSM